MELHYTLSDAEFENQMVEGILDPKLFTHEGHLRYAWIQINKYGLSQAVENVITQIKNYVQLLGAQDKFHLTITIAGVHLVNYHLQKSKAKNFQTLLLTCPEIKSRFKALINSHYSYDIFRVEEARHTYFEPDIQPFQMNYF